MKFFPFGPLQNGAIYRQIKDEIGRFTKERIGLEQHNFWISLIRIPIRRITGAPTYEKKT